MVSFSDNDNSSSELIKLRPTNKKILKNIDSNVKSIKMKLETKDKPEWNYTDQDAWKIDFKVFDFAHM